MFRVPEMPSPRAVVAASARELARTFSRAGAPPTVTVLRAAGRVVCRIQLWDAAAEPPADRAPRLECRAAVMGLLRAAGRAMTRKQVVTALRHEHGPGTIAKALADLVRDGELVNPRDHRGYRLPEAHRRSQTPSLFDPDEDAP